MKQNNENFLDYVFAIKEGLGFSIDANQVVTVDMENTGFTNRLAQKFFNRPKVSHIELEGMGSYIFTCIDGKRNVYDIGLMVHDKYKDDAEPLYERLSVYMKQLEKVNFIERVS